MDVKLYNNNSETNVLYKNLNNETVYSGTLRDSTNLYNPSILISTSQILSNFNYCYIPQFHRYYYINNMEIYRNGVWNLDLKCDVLMSFKNSIAECYAIVNHTTENNTTNYMSSDIWKTLVKDKTDIINFPHGLLETGEYILITAGGNS